MQALNCLFILNPTSTTSIIFKGRYFDFCTLEKTMKKIDEQFQRIKVSLHLQTGSISVHVTDTNISNTPTDSFFPDTTKQSTQGLKYIYFPKNIAMYETDKT